MEVETLALQDEGTYAILHSLANFLITVAVGTIPGLWRRYGGLVKALLHAVVCT